MMKVRNTLNTHSHINFSFTFINQCKKCMKCRLSEKGYGERSTYVRTVRTYVAGKMGFFMETYTSYISFICYLSFMKDLNTIRIPSSKNLHMKPTLKVGMNGL